jgi:hypothetical protein
MQKKIGFLWLEKLTSHPVRLRGGVAKLTSLHVCLRGGVAKLTSLPVCLRGGVAKLTSLHVCLREGVAKLTSLPVCLRGGVAKLTSLHVCLRGVVAKLTSLPVCLRGGVAKLTSLRQRVGEPMHEVLGYKCAICVAVAHHNRAYHPNGPFGAKSILGAFARRGPGALLYTSAGWAIWPLSMPPAR